MFLNNISETVHFLFLGKIHTCRTLIQNITMQYYFQVYVLVIYLYFQRNFLIQVRNG